jgi:hypothetical protein
MMSMPSRLLLAALSITCISALPPQQPLSSSLDHSSVGGPNIENARANANHVFNALHSSVRQWGSSIKHNGMSFFAATIPKGTTMYHGTRESTPVSGMEWLALEIEHAETFARGMRPPGGNRTRPGGPGHYGPPGGPGEPGGPGQPGGPERPGGAPFVQDSNVQDHGYGSGDRTETNDSPVEQKSGYLHTYQANRELRLFYVDGMSAGKTSIGTLDSQDYILRDSNKSTQPFGDYERARDLCTLSSHWGVDGIVRMEAGFEVIFCNFTEGLDLVSINHRPDPETSEAMNEFGSFEYLRAVTSRYHGISGGRINVDFSSMVSAYFYDLNLTNPDPEQSKTPRLVNIDEKSLMKIKSDLGRLLQIEKSHPPPSVNWQGIVDMTVTRYSDRLQFMIGNSTTKTQILSELNILLNVYINYPQSKDDTSAALSRCKNQYLRAVTPNTDSDNMIHAAISFVTGKICEVLFDTRDTLLDSEKDKGSTVQDNNEAEKQAKGQIGELIEWLDWSTWLECGKCSYEKICFVAIWPFGSVENHQRPECLNYTEIRGRQGHWNMNKDL